MIRIVVTGAKGRMGRKVAELVRAASDLSLAAEIDAGDSLAAAARACDVIVDFTTAAASAENAAIAASAARPIVIGTTGLGDAERAAIKGASSRVPVVCAPNMSIGVNVMFALVATAARALGGSYSVDIEETHHVHKLDSPSGTAKRIAEIAARERGPEEIEVRSVRRGEVVGDHEIRFVSPDERLSIAHSAGDRSIFARGAVAAARWIVGKPPGLYDMGDVLGLRSEAEGPGS
ncbi:MAG: 4-hydroxy-tetrahydrodipicolinate reductase [Proteobacteria bacterium]|nr:4-hydroxy-tetrahydrodipicolinate reductase [Pseudomonadota bacterium]